MKELVSREHAILLLTIHAKSLGWSLFTNKELSKLLKRNEIITNPKVVDLILFS